MSNLIEYAYYTSPDGVQYPLFGGKRVLIGWQDIGMPRLEYLQDRGPFQHGVTVRDFRLQPRVVTLDLYERGSKRLDFWCNEAELISLIRPNRSSVVAGGTLLLIRPDNAEIEIGARILEGPSGNWDAQGVRVPADYREALRFFCEDPVWRLPTAGSVTFSPAGGASCLASCLGLSLSSASIVSSQVITYAGTWEGDQITITITGPLENPVIENETTSQTITLNYIVVGGETVTIAILPNLVTVTNNLGVNLIGTVADISDLVTFALTTISDLTTTGQNTITVTGTNGEVGTSTVVFSYFTRHISAFAPC